MQQTPSASYTSTLRVKLTNRPGTLGEVTTAMGRAGGDIGAIDIVSASRGAMVRDITFTAGSIEHVEEIVEAARHVDGVEVVNVSDRTFLMHLGGKIEVVSKMPLKTRSELSMAYTPGVARVCEAIHRDPEKAFTLTIKRNTVAVVSDGTAVLGLGDIPVFHDDQHGTAVVVLAALLNSAKLVGKRMEDLKVVVNGTGAAGVACTKIIMAAGVRNVVGCDQTGALYGGRREHMNWIKDWYAQNTNPDNEQGSVHDVMRGADVFFGLSAPGVINTDDLKKMRPDPIVFAMANPTPEIMPEEAEPYVAVMATGRSDYPNQINNVLCFPGIFKGALQCRASRINEEMKLAAAHAIASIITEEELHPEYIIPSVFDKRVAEAVAREVETAAHTSGVARRERGS